MQMKALIRDRLLDLILKALILIAVLVALGQASKASALFPAQRSDPNALRGRVREESSATRLALMEQARETTDRRMEMFERRLIEHSLEIQKLDRFIVGIQAVAEANTQANWIVGSGFVAQFLFSLMRYLKLQVPKPPRGES